MAIYSYDNTINAILINENCYNGEEIDSYLTEAGTGIEHISGFYQLATSLIALAKKIGGKLIGKKNYTSKSIEYQINRCEKLRDRIDEELEDLKNNNYKIKPSYVAKNFFGSFIALITTTSIEGWLLLKIDKVSTVSLFRQNMNVKYKYGKNFVDSLSDRYKATAKRSLDNSFIDAYDAGMNGIDTDYKKLGITAQKITLIISAILAAGTTVAILSDYKKSLIEWKEALNKSIETLKKAHKKALEKEKNK